MKQAQEHIEAFPTYKLAAEDQTKEHEARYTNLTGGARLTVAKFRADGLTMEHVKSFYANLFKNMSLLSGGRVTSTLIDNDEGCSVIHARISTPIGFSARSNIKIAYEIEEADGFVYIESS